MTEIFNFGAPESIRYAQDQQGLADFRKQYKVSPDQAQFVKVHTEILDNTVRPPQIDVLMGTNIRTTWARFEPPQGFYDQRPHGDYALGSPEKLEADVKRLVARMEEAYHQQKQQGQDSELPGQPLLNVLTEAKDYNSLVEAVKGQMNAFLQG